MPKMTPTIWESQSDQSWPVNHGVTSVRGDDSGDEFYPRGNSSDEDEPLPSIGQLRNGKKRERAHSPTTSDSPGPSTRRRRDVTNAVTSSSSSAPALASASASAGDSSLTAPRWGTDRARNGFLAQFKAIYQQDQAAFYAHVDRHYQDYLEIKRRYRFDDYSDWITANFGETRCFSGIFHAFPNASLTLCLQALMTARRAAAGSI
ncbi:hypothetical protein CEP51_003400 [Fusarium floridanum]|uniref:Uncharacterized protein n=1 Tax=Fusarium floridanum TaxID=1325733 RepID=A0A428S649_9HYPO|nr:hypothetical protein CEP51_003400 [Fusarium floridanum]